MNGTSETIAPAVESETEVSSLKSDALNDVKPSIAPHSSLYAAETESEGNSDGNGTVKADANGHLPSNNAHSSDGEAEKTDADKTPTDMDVAQTAPLDGTTAADDDDDDSSDEFNPREGDPRREQEAAYTAAHKNAKAELGQTWYLVESNWLRSWKNYVGIKTWGSSYSSYPSYSYGFGSSKTTSLSNAPPSEIDNSPLLFDLPDDVWDARADPVDNNAEAAKGDADAASGTAADATMKNGDNDGASHSGDDDAAPEPPTKQPHLTTDASSMAAPPLSRRVLKNQHDIREGIDFEAVSEEEWRLLHGWYGGGPAIPCTTMMDRYGLRAKVDIFPLYLEIYRLSDEENPCLRVLFSKGTKVGELKKKVCARLGLDPANVRVWDFHQKKRHAHLPDMLATLDEAQILNNQEILLEEKGADGKWMRMVKASDYTELTEPGIPGVCGLRNLGNTCFMNSSLQCLSNTVPLREHFLSNAYEAELNRNNPLGMGGELAEVFADLLSDLWSGKYESFAPRDFKLRLERFASQFAGYNQHDSQELLAFLLDGLHEDLNRVTEKPYVEIKDGDGRPDEEVAAEQWQGHLKRNDSFLVDWFQAQLKSRLTCPECQRISVTFDPFMYLSVPLPREKHRRIVVRMMRRYQTSAPIKYSLRVPIEGPVEALFVAISEATGVPADALALADVFSHKVFGWYERTDAMSKIADKDVVWAYEIVPPGDNVSHVKVYARRAHVNSPEFVPRILSFETSPVTHRMVKEEVRRAFERVLVKPPKVSERPSSTFTSPSLHADTRSESVSPSQEAPVSGIALNGDSDDSDDSSILKDTRVHDLLVSPQPVAVEMDTKDDGAVVVPAVQDDDDGEEMEKEKEIEKERVGEDDEEEEEEKAATSSDAAEESDAYPFVLMQKTEGGTYYHNLTKLQGDDEKDDDECTFGDEFAAVFNHAGASMQASVEVDKELIDDASMGVGSSATKQNVTLDDCMQLFMEEEQLGEDDPWYCSGCKEFRQAFKKFDVWSLPRCLVVHLKRFNYQQGSFMRGRGKMDTEVIFPVKGLNMGQYALGPDTADAVYDLYAVSNHFGGLGGGHYIAHCKRVLADGSEQWYKFDDSRVRECDESHVQDSSAYVLFYQRRDAVVADERNKIAELDNAMDTAENMEE